MQPVMSEGTWYDFFADDKELMSVYLTGKPEERIIWFDREWQFYDYELLAEVNDV